MDITDKSKDYKDGMRYAANKMAGKVVVKENEDIIEFVKCTWCRRIMPIVKRRTNSDFDTEACAGCNARA